MSSLTVDPPGNVCKVIAHQANGLIFKGKDDTNNAFVTFTLGKSKFATSVLDRVQTAVWNEECEFVISDHGGTLELVVCHSDFLRERFLGRVEVSVSGIAASYGKCVRKWYKLLPKKGQEGKKTGDRGQLEVTVQILHRKDVESEVKGQDKKSPSLLNILPSPAWRRKSSGASSDGRRRDSHNAQEDFLNDYNMEMQLHDPVNVDPFYSDDSHSIASSMSDDHRSTHPPHHHHHHPLELGGVHLKNGGSSLPNTPPRKGQSKPRVGGLQGSARGKGGLGRNVKAAFGNISKALSKEHVNKIGLSTPDLRFLSSSDPSPPTPQRHKDADRLGDAGADEPDTGPVSPSQQQGKERVHLGVSSLVGSLHPQATPLSHAVSEESLLTAKDKVQSDMPKDREEAYAYTTLPRGKHAKGHTRHKKTMSACITTLSELGYHDDGGDRSHRNHSPAPEKPPHGEERHRENREGREGRTPRGGSKYDTLSRQQLVHLVQEQETILSANLIQIKELESYIEKLLLRVMVESPQLLDQNHPIRL